MIYLPIGKGEMQSTRYFFFYFKIPNSINIASKCSLHLSFHFLLFVIFKYSFF